MTRQAVSQTAKQDSTNHPLSRGILQRKCESCGQHTMGGGKCESCEKQESFSPNDNEQDIDIQRKSASNLVDSSFNYNFSGVPVSKSSLPIQPKLKIGQPNDKYEQEADRIADQVMRMPEGKIQRKMETEEEEEELIQTKPISSQITPLIQRQTEEEDEEEIQTKEKPGHTPVVNPAIEGQINAMRGGGQPLPDSTRSFYESRFGADFSQVRIHTDSQAAKLAQSVNARAFTVKQDIVFGKKDFNTDESQHLLAHELTHFLQQTSSARVASTGTLLQRAVDNDEAETETLTTPQQDLGRNLLDQSDKFQKQIERIRYRLKIIINELVEPGLEGVPSALEDFDVPPWLRQKTKAAAKRFLGITQYLEQRKIIESVLMTQWLDAAEKFVSLLRSSIRYFSKNYPEEGSGIETRNSKKLTTIARMIRKLRKSSFFQEGASIEVDLREQQAEEISEELERRVDKAYKKYKRAAAEQWLSESDVAIEVEIYETRMLLARAPDYARVFYEGHIAGLKQILDERSLRGTTTTVTDESERLVKLAQKGRGATAASEITNLIVNAVQDRQQMLRTGAIVTGALSRIQNDSRERADEITRSVLTTLAQRVPKALQVLSSDKEGKRIHEWLVNSDSADRSFARILVDLDIPSAQAQLDAMSSVETPGVIRATVQILGYSGLRRVATQEGGQQLLVDMSWRLFDRGYDHSLRDPNRRIAQALAPTRGYHGKVVELPSLEGITFSSSRIGKSSDNERLKVTMSGRGIFDLENAGFTREQVNRWRFGFIEVRPTDVLVFKQSPDDPGKAASAMELVALEKSGQRNILSFIGQETVQAASETLDIVSQNAQSFGKKVIGLSNKSIDKGVALAKKQIANHVPTEYQGLANEVVTSLGKATKTIVAGHVGSAVGVVEGVTAVAEEGVQLTGQVMSGTGSLLEAAEKGQLVGEMQVSFSEASKTLRVAIEFAPDMIDPAVEALLKADSTEIAFEINRTATKLVVETVLPAGLAGKASKVGKVLELGDDLRDASRALGKVYTPLVPDVSPVNLLPDKRASQRVSETARELPHISHSRAQGAKELPSESAVRRPRSSGEDIQPPRIIEKELQEEHKKLKPANEPPPLPPEAKAKELPKVAAGGTSNAEQLPQIPDAFQNPDLRVIPGEVPEASIKGKPEPAVPSTSTTSPSKPTQSLPSQSHTTPPVFEGEQNLLEKINFEILREEKRLVIAKRQARELWDKRQLARRSSDGEAPDLVLRHREAMAERNAIQKNLQQLREERKALTKNERKAFNQSASKSGFDAEEQWAKFNGYSEMHYNSYPAIDGVGQAVNGVGRVGQLKRASWNKPNPSLKEIQTKVTEKITEAFHGMHGNNWRRNRRMFNTTHREQYADKFGFEMPENWRDPSISIQITIKIIAKKPVGWLELQSELRKFFQNKFRSKNAFLDIVWSDS